MREPAGGTAAPVNRILPLSTVDGPGARAAIFLQGCNLACLYCHNPETQQLCRHCGVCVAGCPAGALEMREQKVIWDPALCTGCDACIKICPFYASPKVTWQTPRQVFERIRPNFPFVRGVSVSGGECTLYPTFLTELFTLVREAGRTCLIDFNGVVDLAALPELMAVTDGVMLDIKAWKPEVFRRLTGAESNDTMKRNLVYLSAADKLTELRLVYMPGYVDAADALQGVADTLGERRNGVRLKLIGYRSHGVRGEAEGVPSTAREEMEELGRLALQKGFLNCVVV